jgi:alpha-mannosidase
MPTPLITNDYYAQKIAGNIAKISFSKLEEAAKSGDVAALRNNDWMTVGPFVLETDGAFETEYLYEREKILSVDYLEKDGGEAATAPYLGLTCHNTGFYGPEKLTWEKGMLKWDMLRFDADEGDAACDKALFATEQRNAIFYAAVYVECESEKDAVVCYENSGCLLYLNGQLIDNAPYGRVKGLVTMGRQVAVSFQKGLNLLLFKLRPGYICDTVDLSMTNCTIYPIAARVNGLGIAYPSKTAVFVGDKEAPMQVFPVFAAALSDTEGGSLSLGKGEPLAIPALSKGQCHMLRAEFPAPSKAQTITYPFVLTEGSARASGEFTVRQDAFNGFTGDRLLSAAFHFDTTYHQEQRVYAMGAIDITMNMLKAMRENESFRAVMSEVDYLHPYYSLYPHDREYLKQVFVEGRADADCFYNQPNEMTSSPEGIVRNMAYGQLYHRDVLGRICKVYSPGDVFGHPNQLSQICRKGGCDGIYWGKHIFGFPPAFRHVSPDGESLIHRRGGIGVGFAKEKNLSFTEGDGRAFSTVPAFPVDGNMEWMERTIPKARYAIAAEYQEAMSADEERIVAETGVSPFVQTSRDMSLYHAGVALTRTDLKQANRLAENLLITAEKLAVIAALCGAAYPEKALDKAWRQILCGQHHDSITGTNNEISFVDLMVEYREAVELAADIMNRASAFIASCVAVKGPRPFILFNPHTWDRKDPTVVTLRLDKPVENYVFKDEKGKTYKFQAISQEETQNGYLVSAVFSPKMPALGFATYYLEEGDNHAPAKQNSDTTIENRYFKLTVDPEKGGGIISLYDKTTGRELINPLVDGPANRLVALKEMPNRMEAQHEFYTTGHKLTSGEYEATVQAEKGKEFEKLTITYSLGTVVYVTQEITLHANSRRIDFVTRLDDYQDQDDLFTVTFPVALRGAKPIFDDRFAPAVRNESKNLLSFQTHQYAMFSHCAVYAANQWLDYGPTVTLALQNGDEKGSINAGMLQIIRPDGNPFAKATESLLHAFTKKAVPVTVFPDGKQSCVGSQIIHFNEDLASSTRIVLTLEDEKNEYVEKLLADAGRKGRELEKKVKKDGKAILYLRDSDNLWQKPIDVLVLAAKKPEQLEELADQIVKALAKGHKVALKALLADLPGEADDYGIALLNTGNIACSVEKGGVLNLMLFHTADFYGNIGNTNDGKPLIPEQKSHVFTYSLYPHEGSYREAEVYRRALELNDPVFAVERTESRNPTLPERQSYLKTDENVIVTAVKAGGYPMASMKDETKPISERGIAIRFFEPNGLDTETTIETGFDFSAAFSTDLLEEQPEPVSFKGKKLSYSVPTHSIETLVLYPTGAKTPEVSIGAEKEPVEPTYIRSWEHDLGTMPMGYLALAAVISRNPKKISDTEFTTEVSIANNRTDATVSGEATLILPGGWKADRTRFAYELAPGAHVVFPLRVEKPTADAKGILRLLYEDRGQQFEDIFEVGYFNPVMTLHLEENAIVALIENPTGQSIAGELSIASSIETWGDLGGKNPFARMSISPRTMGVVLEPGQRKEYRFALSGDPDLSFWATAKLMVNGRIHFKTVTKQREHHCIWAHEFINDIYRDGGSLEKLLKLN